MRDPRLNRKGQGSKAGSQPALTLFLLPGCGCRRCEQPPRVLVPIATASSHDHIFPVTVDPTLKPRLKQTLLSLSCSSWVFYNSLETVIPLGSHGRPFRPLHHSTSLRLWFPGEGHSVSPQLQEQRLQCLKRFSFT